MKIQYLFTLSIICTILMVYSCKTESEQLNFLGKDYFGYTIGQTRYYKGDSIIFNSFNLTKPKTTVNYIIRERVLAKFIDDEGDEVYRLHRDISFNQDTSYDFYNLATIQINSMGVEYVENNTRYLRLAFPIREKRNWNGNLYNNLDAQRYIYQNVGKPYNTGFMQLSNTISVNEKDEITIISEKTSNKVYAKDIGMVSLEYKNVDIDNGKKDGIELNWKLESFVP